MGYRCMFRVSLIVGVCLVAVGLNASAEPKRDANLVDKFRQLGHEVRDPNVYRNAAGAPGHEYWQQNADYRISAELDENARTVSADATLTYTNNSPDTLPYLWIQLDQNRFREDSIEHRSRTGRVAEDGISDQLSFWDLRRHQAMQDVEHGYRLGAVTDGRGADLPYTVNSTMLRLDLPTPLKPGAKQVVKIAWSFDIPEADAMNSRGGYEHFEKTDTYAFFLAQWFPRFAAYTDYTGWQNKQFIGRGEFALEFGDYDVSLTVPADHIVSATGELVNEKAVLSATQLQRLNKARDADAPVFIVTPDEALENEKDKASGTKTWRFKAERVRDFAWSSSRKFIWDAMIHRQDEGRYRKVLAMSFYPNEAEPIWSQYSTEAVVHTMDVYTRFSFPYPYPTAQSVNTWTSGGMEYPMITFNGYRPKPIEDKEDLVDDAPDGTYSRAIKYRLIGVIIHEIGHIYFPMVVNTDERRWTWMDEGINTFLEYVAELEWEENFADPGGNVWILDQIRSYMISQNQVPIMTHSDSVLQFGPNAYTKPAAALVVLRETVMGRELFDFAFKEYSRRWRFKRPTPTDFFRTMEDASGVDLDWFWRGWFYSTEHVDVDLAAIREYQVSTLDPEIENPARQALDAEQKPENITQLRNRESGMTTRLQRREALNDFYNENDTYTVSNKARNDYKSALEELEPWERRVLQRAIEAGEYIYFLDFENKGGLLTPLPLTLTYADQTQEEIMVPAEIWRRNPNKVTKLLILPKALKEVELDARHQTADTDRSNNYFPRRIMPSRLELYKREHTDRDLMLDMLAKLKAKQDPESEGVPLEQAAQ